MKKLLSLSLLLCTGVFAAPSAIAASSAQDTIIAPHKSTSFNSIILTVNKDAITRQDIDARIRLVLLTSGMPYSPEIVESMRSQVVKSLIDEKLQTQAADSQKIIISQTQITEEITKLATENNMDFEKLKTLLKEQGIPIKTLENRIRAQIAWARYIREYLKERYPAQIQVSDQEVEQLYIKRTQDHDQTQFEVLEIFLRIDNPSQTEIVKKDADRIYTDLQNGANFRVLARQISQGTSNATGGYIGWIPKGQFDSSVDSILEKMEVSEFSAPIRVPLGYRILMLLDKKQAGQISYGQREVSYKQVIVPFDDAAPVEEQEKAMAHIEELQKVNGCANFEKTAKNLSYEITEVKRKFKEIPEGFQKLFTNSPVGTMLQPIRIPEGALSAMLCSIEVPSKKNNTDQTPEEIVKTKAEISNTLEQDKTRKLAERELIMLHSIAYINHAEEVPSHAETKKK